jgi:hypothetical protein
LRRNIEGTNSSEPICQPNGNEYNATQCRLITWKALIKNWKAGKAKAIGVSNFNKEHLQEIIDAKLPLPSVNQIPVNPHLYVRCAFSDRNLHSRMPLDPTHVRLKRCHACDQ